MKKLTEEASEEECKEEMHSKDSEVIESSNLFVSEKQSALNAKCALKWVKIIAGKP